MISFKQSSCSLLWFIYYYYYYSYRSCDAPCLTYTRETFASCFRPSRPGGIVSGGQTSNLHSFKHECFYVSACKTKVIRSCDDVHHHPLCQPVPLHLDFLFAPTCSLSPDVSLVLFHVVENLYEETAVIVWTGDGAIIINKTIKVY